MEVLRPDVFKVDETTYFDMEFPEGIQVKCKTSFAESMNHLKVNCSEGWYELKPFQSYSGVSGRSSDAKVLEAFRGNQQARQMDDDALAIINRHQPLVPGEEGLKDIRIVEAIMKSAANDGKRISLQ
jgi:glucose-fructose oxidoreductase